jgi:hypothetical protein
MRDPGEEKIGPRRLKEVLQQALRTANQRPTGTDAELAAGFGMDNPIDEWDPSGDALVRHYRGPAGG